MDALLLWGLGLLAGAVVVGLLEIFVPSHGLLAFASAAMAVAGVVCLWRHDEGWGLSGALALLVLAPAGVYFGLRIWPSTPLGRKIIGAPTEEDVQRQRRAEEAERQQRLALVGQTGVVVVELRPIGVVEVGGKRYDAVSETSFAKPGSKVKVAAAEPNQLRVRPQA
jgi:membrane-bound ClpP family serine protease